jgi:hypothetical protein
MKKQIRWGPWCLDKGSIDLVLRDDEGREMYWFSLAGLTDSAEVLDCIAQIAMKTWATDVVLASLVRALCDILEPQARLCCSGQHKQVTSTEAQKWAADAYRRIPAERKELEELAKEIEV